MWHFFPGCHQKGPNVACRNKCFRTRTRWHARSSPWWACRRSIGRSGAEATATLLVCDTTSLTDRSLPVQRRHGGSLLRQLEGEDAPVAGDVEAPRGDKDGGEVAQSGHAFPRLAPHGYLLAGIAPEAMQSVISLGADDPDNRFGTAVRGGDDRRS